MAKHPRANEFDVFGPSQVEALVALIERQQEKYGAANVRLEVHTHGKDVNLWVIGDDEDGDTDSPPDDDDDDQPINDSCRCPGSPCCP